MVAYQEIDATGGSGRQRRHAVSTAAGETADRAMQSMSFSTAAFRAPEAVGAWREVFGRTLLKIDITPLSGTFGANARVVGWPGFGLIEASTSAAHQANSKALIANDDLSFGRISFMASSNARRWRAAQLGREAELGAGDGVLMSNSDVGSIILPNDCRYTTFAVPAAALEARVPDVSSWFACRVASDNPAMRLLSSYLRLARDERCLATPALRDAFARHVVDLLALAIGAMRDAAEMARSRGGRAARLHAIRQDIRNALDRPDLSVSLVAAWHGLSPRYVQLLFEESGTTFTQFVQEQRLEKAYRTLTDAARFAASISAIAFDCGFADLSNFNRAFRNRFGCTPGDVRRGSQHGPEARGAGHDTALIDIGSRPRSREVPAGRIGSGTG